MMHYVWNETETWLNWSKKCEEFRREANKLSKLYGRGLDAFKAREASNGGH